MTPAAYHATRRALAEVMLALEHAGHDCDCDGETPNRCVYHVPAAVLMEVAGSDELFWEDPVKVARHAETRP